MTAPTLPYPEYLTSESKKTVKDRVLEAQFGNGFGQTAPDGANSIIDSWTLHYKPLSDTKLAEVRAFLASVGTSTWFYWTPFGESTPKKWKRVKDSLQEDMSNYNLIKISFQIEQNFSLGT